MFRFLRKKISHYIRFNRFQRNLDRRANYYNGLGEYQRSLKSRDWSGWERGRHNKIRFW